MTPLRLVIENMVMSKVSEIGPFGRCPLRVVAAGLIALFLLLMTFAASPGLHLAIHADANHAEHHCAISLLAQAQVDLSINESVLSVAPAPFSYAHRVLIAISHASIELLPPGRAPPSVFA